MARNWKLTDPYPSGSTFGELLEWHLTVWGTNPAARKDKPDRPWVLRNFAAALRSGLPDGKDENGPEKTLRNWRNGTYLPDAKDERRLFELLFGINPELADWKQDLRNALDREREKKSGHRAATRVDELEACIVPRCTPFLVGRDLEVETLAAMLVAGQGSAVIVQGGPGVGKTELTKAIANVPAIISRFGLRRYFVQLEGADSTDGVRQVIARAATGNPATRFDEVMRRLCAGPTLVVLDNLETPWEPIRGRFERG